MAVTLANFSACSDSADHSQIESVDGVAKADELSSKDKALSEIKAEDRAVFISLIQGLSEYTESNLYSQLSTDPVADLESKDKLLKAVKTHYQVRFFDQYTLTGTADKTVKVGCESSEYSNILLLQSDDTELTIRSQSFEKQALDNSQAEYTSSYFYQVDADKVDVNQAIEGQFKRQFNGIAHHQTLPFTKDVLHSEAALFLHQTKRFKLEKLATINSVEKSSIVFNYISLPEDIDNSEVYNLVEASYLPFSYNQASLDAYQLLSKHFIQDENGEWVEDGHSVEWLTASGIVLFESFVMPTGLSMQYWLQSAAVLDVPKC